jgi:DNA-binding MarR family transcriptional regulator
MTQSILRLDAFLPYRLSIASNTVSDVISQAYAKLFGLTIPEWRLIAVIAEADGLTQQEICLRTHMDKVTVSRAAIGLSSRGLVLRQPNPQDGRSHRLSLSETGRQLYDQVVPKAIELDQQIFGKLSSEALEQFVRSLVHITEMAAGLLDAGVSSASGEAGAASGD